MSASPSPSPSPSPVTAASLAEAKLHHAQSRLNFLWNAAHSSLALDAPIIAATYMRQLRLLAFHSEITFSSRDTQLSCCSNCGQVNVPPINTTVTIKPSKLKLRRQKRRQRIRAAIIKKKQDELEQSTSADSAPEPVTASTPHKRKRSPSPGTPLSASPFSATSPSPPSSKSHASHDVVYHCHSCGHSDRANGMTSRQRQMLKQSNTDMQSMIEQENQRQAHASGAVDEAKESATKKARLLASLQTQSLAPSAPAMPKPNLASLQSLQQAQQKLQQAKQQMQQQQQATSGAVTGSAGLDSLLRSKMNVPSNSFFADQMKDAVGISNVTTTANTQKPVGAQPSSKPFSFSASTTNVAKPSSAPFTFSKSAASTGSAGGGSALYSMLQQSAPTASAATSTAAAPFSFSLSNLPKKTPSNPPSTTPSKKAADTAPLAANFMAGIQIVGGMKATAAAKSTPSKKK